MFRSTITLVGVAAFAAALTFTLSSPAKTPDTGATYQGKTAFQWHQIAVKRRLAGDRLQRRLTVRVLESRSLRRSLVSRPSSEEALRLAAITWNVSYDLLYRIASCESTGGNGLNANAQNRTSTAAGLGQFLDSSWAATIYAHESVYDPYANALAMGKEVHDGHTGWQWAASRRCWG